MRKSLVTAIVAVAVTATFIGGAYVGNKAKETQTSYADAVQAVGEAATTETAVDDYINRVSDADAVQVVPSDQVTEEMLEGRNGKIIVEKMVGVVDDDEGNGHILNPYVDGYNYIMYGGHVDFHKGDIVVTYNVYNPEDNAIDDIIARSDYVVGNVNE